MIEVVVYIKKDYSVNKSIFLPSNSTKEDIKIKVNSKFAEWYFYDII